MVKLYSCEFQDYNIYLKLIYQKIGYIYPSVYLDIGIKCRLIYHIEIAYFLENFFKYMLYILI